MIRRAAVLLLLVAIGCASSSSSHAQPEIQLVQVSSVAEAARNVTGGIPVQFRVTIHNTTPAALQLRHIELVSQGDGAYNLQTISRAYDQAIETGVTQSFDLWGSANVAFATISGANGPVTIRAVVQFDGFQSVVVQQVHATGGV